MNRSQQKVEARLERIIAAPVERGECLHVVAGLRIGDDGFAWNGAAGRPHAARTTAMRADHPIFIASITKIFTATLIMQLHEAGQLSLSDPLTKHLPERFTRDLHVLKGRDYSDQLTIEHLLAQTSGLADYFAGEPDGEASIFTRLKAGEDLAWDTGEAVERARALTPEFAPGSGRAFYSDTNYQLLGAVCEAAAGQPLHAMIESRICEPLGLRDTYLYGFRPGPLEAPADIRHGTTLLATGGAMKSFKSDGGLVSTVDECLRFLRALRAGELFENPATFASMQTWQKIFFPFRYGFGLMRFRIPLFFAPFGGRPEFIGHSGASGAFLFFHEHGPAPVYLAGTCGQTDRPDRSFRMMLALSNALKELNR